MNVLVLNCGSSSVKFQVIDTSLKKIDAGGEECLGRGLVERIGLGDTLLRFEPKGGKVIRQGGHLTDHRQAIEEILKILTKSEYAIIGDLSEIGAVGHRVVHGGERFARSMVVDDEVEAGIEECIDLAPLHNPANLRGYRMAKQLLPEIPHCAVFDTSFHQSMPPHAFMYGLPYSQYTKHGIRRYGFHGTSHRFMAFRLHKIYNVPRFGVHCISCHLGNGCSITAISEGRSLDTSMGFTPLEGLMMGTRTGDLDPSAIFYMMGREEMALHEVNTLLNKHSGLIGVSGVSNDMRELLRHEYQGNERASLAIKMFCYRAAKYIASYLPVVGPKIQAITFTGGIGENSPEIRKRIIEQLNVLGIFLDDELNGECIGRECMISSEKSRTPVYAIPTNEELVIARDTIRAIEGVL
ncbi:acetate kinase [bacterium]|nr:acetate kinase [bacterium]